MVAAVVVGKMPVKRQCTGSEDGASPAKILATSEGGRSKTSAKVLPLPKDESSTSAALQPSSSSSSASAAVSHSSSSSSSSEDEERDDDISEPATAAASHPASLLAVVKEKPTMSELVMKNVESILRLVNK